MNPSIELLISPDWAQYELLDSGDGRKLEKFGPYTFIRPEHQALWTKNSDDKLWSDAHGEFLPTSGDEAGGHWKLYKRVPETWIMNYKDLNFEARLTNSRHFGVFPEQAVHWEWIVERIKSTPHKVSVLNLFGHTGLASLVAAQAGASVTHIDASKKSVSWARTNQAHSSLQKKPVRWIVDDAVKFVQREGRRGMHYDGIILDPPKFGRGPKGEVWDSLEMLPTLLKYCRKILVASPMFIVITAYAIRASALSLYYLLDEMMGDFRGVTTCGELAVKEASGARVISTAIFSRWGENNNRKP